MQEMVEVGQGPELVADNLAPVAQMEAGEEMLVNPRQVSVAEELGDVQQLIVQPGQIDADFAQIAADLPADPPGTGQIAIGGLQRPIQHVVKALLEVPTALQMIVIAGTSPPERMKSPMEISSKPKPSWIRWSNPS